MSLSHAYAKVIQNAEQKGEGDSFLSKLISFMQSRGHMSLLGEIVRILEREPAAAKASVTLARESDASKFKDTLAQHLQTLGVGKDEYTLTLDPKMVGGYRINAGGKLIDKSYRSALVSIYQKAVQD